MSSRQQVLAAECIYYWLRAGPWPSSGKILLIKRKSKNLVNTSNNIEHLQQDLNQGGVGQAKRMMDF